MPHVRQILFKRLSIAMDGTVIRLVKSAASVGAALDDELNSYIDTDRIPAQINITEEVDWL